MSPTVKYGLLGGLTIAAIQILLYYVSFEASQSLGIGSALGLIIPIVLMVLGVKAERENQEGFISFGEALKTAFFVYMLCTIVSGVISFAHMKTYSDETWEQIAEIQKEGAMDMVKMFGAESAELEEAFDEQFDADAIKEQTSSINALLLGILVAAFFGIIISLIIAAIMKRNPTP